MSNCNYCGNDRWGMVRYRRFTSRGYLVFCRKKCEQEYEKQKQAELRKRKFLAWLYDPG